MHIQRPVFPFGFKAPDAIHQRRTRQNNALIAQQQAQQFKFLVGKRYILTPDLDLVPVRRDKQQAKREISACLHWLCPP